MCLVALASMLLLQVHKYLFPDGMIGYDSVLVDYKSHGGVLTCLPAPYIYITYHGKPNNVRKFSRDGCDLGDVLLDMPKNASGTVKLRELRGMYLHNKTLPDGTHKESFYVLAAHKGSSQLLEYGSCDPVTGQRPFVALIASNKADKNSLLVHPYAVTVGPLGYVYVSTQDTSMVLRMSPKGDFIPPPQAIRYQTMANGGDASTVPNGTFVQFYAWQEVRGITFDNEGIIYVAVKENGVFRFDLEGFNVGLLPITKPIALWYDANRRALYAGSNKGKHSVVYEWDVVLGKVNRTLGIDDKQLSHPAGIVSYKDTLYVISQDENEIVSYDLSTGLYKRSIYHGFPSAGEQLILSAC